MLACSSNSNYGLTKQAGIGSFIGRKLLRPMWGFAKRNPIKATLGVGAGAFGAGALAEKLFGKKLAEDPYKDAYKVDTKGWKKPTEWYNTPVKSANAVAVGVLTKQAGLGTLAKGLVADTATLFGRFGLGGMMRGTGRMLGGGADDAIQHGLTGKIFKIGDILPDGTEIKNWDDIGDVLKRLNDPLHDAAKNAGKFFDDATEGYRRISVTRNGKQTGLLSGIGQRLMKGGDWLIRQVDKADDAYRKSLVSRWGKNTWGHKLARGAMGASSMGIPIAYTMASEMAPENTWWAYPGKAVGKAFEYITPLGLASKGLTAAGEKLGETIQDATMEGARFGADMTAAELANTGRGAYLVGALSPGKLSREVSRQANEKIDQILMMQKVQQSQNA